MSNEGRQHGIHARKDHPSAHRCGGVWLEHDRGIDRSVGAWMERNQTGVESCKE